LLENFFLILSGVLKLQKFLKIKELKYLKEEFGMDL
jgi:hypothetical protein